MIDLTPLDVRKKRGDFRRILRGYDPEEVDTFMDLVADRFEELVRQNLHLSEKAESLESQLESLTGREQAVQEALVSAQKLREELRTQSHQDAETRKVQAEREAELLRAEAQMEIERRLGEAEGLIRERQRALEELERSRLKFLRSFRGLLEREMDAVEVEEARRPLEEKPLELEFRSWTHASDAEESGIDGASGPIASTEAFEAVEVSEASEAAEATEVPEAMEAPEVPEAMEAPEVPGAMEATEPTTQPIEPSVPVGAGEAGEALEDEGAAEIGALAYGAEEEVAEGAGEGGIPPEVEPLPATDDLHEVATEPDGFETQVLESAAPVGIDDLAPAETETAEGAASEGPEGISGDGGEAPEPGPGEDQDGDPSGEPKWLFSLLKKEEEKESEG